MCELLGRGTSEEERDRLFTVGLFSVADALLDASMEQVLETLPFSEEITGALLRYEGPLGRTLATVLRYEQGHFPRRATDRARAGLPRRAQVGRRRGALGRLMMARMPLRFKLTLAFTGVMAVLLTGAGIALSVLVANNLDNTIDDGLAARAGDAAAVVAAGPGSRRSTPPARRSRRCSTPDGDVVDTTTGAGDGLAAGPGVAGARRARAS